MAYITGLTQDEKQYGSKKKVAITATAGQTVFVPGFDYIPGSNVLEVFINGVKQAGSAYTESQGFITLSEGVVAGDLVEIVSDVVEHRLTGEVEWLRRNYGPLVADPTRRPNGDAMVAGDEYFNSVSGKKRYYNGAIWVDNNGLSEMDLGDPYGSALVGVATYAQLRAYTGDATRMQVGGRSSIFDGASGVFVRTGSAADNDGTVLKDSLNRSWVRQFDGDVNALWFGAKADWNGSTGTDNTLPLRKAFDAARGKTLFIPALGSYRVTGRIGTDNTIASDLADNTHIRSDGAYIVADYAAFTAHSYIFSLEGNNVSISGLYIQSTIDFDLYNTNPENYRAKQLGGVLIGGKAASYNGIADSLSYYKTGALVENVYFTNIHSPIIMTQTSHGVIRNCDLYKWTQTGIVVWGCPSDITVENNRAFLGADDCIFLYNPKASQSAWTSAGNYAGSHKVLNNTLGLTRAKFIGTGGYSDVRIAGNKGNLSLCQGIAIEADPTIFANGAIYNRNIVVEDNDLDRCGRFYDATSGYDYWRGPVATEDVGITTLRSPATTGTRPKGISINRNKIRNPNGNGLYLGYASASADGNEIVAGINDYAGSVAPTNGYAIFTARVGATYLTNNKIRGDGANWLYTYAIINEELTAKDIHIRGNTAQNGETFAPIGGSGVSPFTSELLDYAADVNYYQGQWTPTITATGSQPTVTYTSRIGQFTRVGGVVHCQLVLNFNITVGGSGALLVSLPFVHSNAYYANQRIGYTTGVELYDNIAPLPNAATAQLSKDVGGTASNAALTGARQVTVQFSYTTANS